MQKAYVLINCDLGSEVSLIKELNHLNEVKEVQGVYGAFDIMAKIEGENYYAISKLISNKVRTLDHIQSTTTLIDVESMERPPQMAELIPDVIPDEKKPIEPPEGADIEYDEDEDEEEEDFSNKN